MVEPPRIAVVLPDLRGGGAERVQLTLATEFAERGISTDLVVMSAVGELLGQVPSHVRLIDLNAPRVRKVIPPLAAYLEREEPDAVVAAMWPLTSATIVARALSRARARVLLSEHCRLSIQYRNWGLLHRLAMQASIRLTYPLADHLVGVSAGVSNEISQLSGLPSGRVATIHNPVSVPTGAFLEVAHDPGWTEGRKRILSIGNLKPEKNHRLLIEAFQEVVRDADGELVILGEGPQRPELEALVRELQLADRVRLPGYCADPLPWLASADLFVLSSDHEGFGNVLVEALGAGLPIVSTDCPSGPSEILDGGRYGRLVPVADKEALAREMRLALERGQVDQERLRRRSMEFSPKIAAKAYLELLFPRGGS